MALFYRIVLAPKVHSHPLSINELKPVIEIASGQERFATPMLGDRKFY